MDNGAIFPLFYLPPVEYFSKVLKHKNNILLEKWEHFPKQTFRNRATIHSPNGPLDLIVPVVKGSKTHTIVKDVKISYDFNWQRLHLLSMQTSYRSSAYFEFYEDNFLPFYQKKFEYLFDYNLEMLDMLLKALKFPLDYSFTENYVDSGDEIADYRQTIHPKHSTAFAVKPYFQVFEERNGFLPNLSIVDLLFNQGPQSSKYL